MRNRAKIFTRTTWHRVFIREKIRLLQCDPPFIDLHAATWVFDNDYVLQPTARRFETWEQNIAAKLGLGVAIDYALNIGIDVIWERIQYLAHRLREQLKQIPSITLQDLGKNQCGIITFTSKNRSAFEIKNELTKQQINVSISLQEYARLDLASQGTCPGPSPRLFLHYYNTEDEIDNFCKAISNSF